MTRSLDRMSWRCIRTPLAWSSCAAWYTLHRSPSSSPPCYLLRSLNSLLHKTPQEFKDPASTEPSTSVQPITFSLLLVPRLILFDLFDHSFASLTQHRIDLFPMWDICRPRSAYRSVHSHLLGRSLSPISSLLPPPPPFPTLRRPRIHALLLPPPPSWLPISVFLLLLVQPDTMLHQNRPMSPTPFITPVPTATYSLSLPGLQVTVRRLIRFDLELAAVCLRLL